MPAARRLSPQQAGTSLALWLAQVHPEIFNRLVGKAISRGLGDWTDVAAAPDLTPVSSDTSVGLQMAVEDALPTVSAIDVSGGTSEPAILADNNSSASSWISGVGSGLTNAIGSVGNWLSSATGLTSLANVATGFFKAQAAGSAATAQTAVLQTQIARAQAGLPAAPVSYVRNPMTGQVQPVYVGGSGVTNPYITGQAPILTSGTGMAAYPLTTAGLNSLMPSGLGAFFSQYGVWIVGAGALLLILSSMGGRSRED